MLAIAFAATQLMAQQKQVYQIRADSVRIYSGCDTAELIIENRTKDTLGFLYNKGNGRTEFRKLRLQAVGSNAIAITGQDTLQLGAIIKTAVDTLYTSGNVLTYRKTDGKVYSVTIGTTETLQTVTARGRITTQDILFAKSSSNPSNGLEWGYQTDTWKIFAEVIQDEPSGNLVFSAADNGTEGWIFRFDGSSIGGPKTDILSFNRDRLKYKGLDIFHAGNLVFNTKGANTPLKTESDGKLGVENWIRVGNGMGMTTVDGGAIYQKSASSWALRSSMSPASNVVWLEMLTGDGGTHGSLYAAGGSIGFTGPSGTGWRLKTDASGNTSVTGQVTATGFLQSSLRSLKRDINPFTSNATEILQEAKVRTFYFKADSSNTKHIGFIADELPDEMSGPDHQEVDESNTVALLVKALQEMNAKVEALELEVKQLKEEKHSQEKQEQQ